MARAKVPTKTMILRILILVNQRINCNIIVQKRKLTIMMYKVFDFITSSNSGLMNDDPFAPLINIKYIMAVILIDPQIAP